MLLKSFDKLAMKLATFGKKRIDIHIEVNIISISSARYNVFNCYIYVSIQSEIILSAPWKAAIREQP